MNYYKLNKIQNSLYKFIEVIYKTKLNYCNHKLMNQNNLIKIEKKSINSDY
jgi:hypothetical protein